MDAWRLGEGSSVPCDGRLMLPPFENGSSITPAAAAAPPDLFEVLVSRPLDGASESASGGAVIGGGRAVQRSRVTTVTAAAAAAAPVSPKPMPPGTARPAARVASARLAVTADNNPYHSPLASGGLGTAGSTAGLDELPPSAADERAALLAGEWPRSDAARSSNSNAAAADVSTAAVASKYGRGGFGAGGTDAASPAVGAIPRPMAAAGRTSASGAGTSGLSTARDRVLGGGNGGGSTQPAAATLTRRGAGRPWSPFELSVPAAAGLVAAGVTAPGLTSSSPAAGPVVGTPIPGAGSGGAWADRTPSTTLLLTAATSAGDLHTAVPPPPPPPPPPPAAYLGGAGGQGFAARSAAALVPAVSTSFESDAAQLRGYMRSEQLRHAAEAHRAAVRRSTAAARRALMLGVTAVCLGAAAYTARTPWGRRERGGLPHWRWLLIVGCLPSVWYVPWYAIFLLVLLLESLLPAALAAAGGGGAGGGRSGAFAAQAAQDGMAGGGGGEERGGGGGGGGGELAGPALVIYHLLGVRRHMVRALRCLAAQLLVHFAVADKLTGRPGGQSREAIVMKAWTCVTLFLAASALKSLAAKALSKHFHSRGYLQRMQRAVKQELVLMALSRPRPGRARRDALTHLGLGYHLARWFAHNGAGATAGSGGSTGVTCGGSGGSSGGDGKSYGNVVRSPFAAAADGGGGGAAASHAVVSDGGDDGGAGGGGAGGGGAGGGGAGGGGAGGGGAGGGGAGGGGAGGGGGQGPSLRERVSVPSAVASCTATETPPGHLPYSRGVRHTLHSVPDLTALTATPQRHYGPGDVARDGGGGGSLYGNEGAAHGGSGGAGAGRGGGCGSSETGGGGRWRRLWRSLERHFRHAYGKTRMQWDLSRPKPHSLREGGAVGASGGSGGGDGGGAAASGGGGGGGTPGATSGRNDGLNFDQLRTSLFWLEQHIRRNKLQMGVTLSDQLRAAAEVGGGGGGHWEAGSGGGGGGGGGAEVASKTEAKRLAFYLHVNVLGLSDLRGRMYLVARDFEPFFSSAEEVREAFAMFDSDHDGRITLQNMVDTIVRIYKERKKLALTLQDTRTVVAKLELICGVVVHVLFGFGYLTIWQVNVRELWLTFSSVTLAFVFVFGNSIRSIYEAVLFLFVVHPFDVGDWLLLANGETVKVEEIALLFCTFLRGDGHRLYYPNPKLIGEPIVNISRSETYWDSATLLVDLATRGSVIEAVEGRLKGWLADNPKQYTGAGGISARALATPSKLQLTAAWEYCHTGEDQGRTARWRSKALLVLASAFESCGVAYSLPPIKGCTVREDGRVDREAAAVVGLGLGLGRAGGEAATRSAAAVLAGRGRSGGGACGAGGELEFLGVSGAKTMQ